MAYLTISMRVPKCLTISGGFTIILSKSDLSNYSLSIASFYMSTAAREDTINGLSLTVMYPTALLRYYYNCLVPGTRVCTLRNPLALNVMNGGYENAAYTANILIVSMTGRGSAYTFNFGIMTDSVWLSISMVDVIYVLSMIFSNVNI